MGQTQRTGDSRRREPRPGRKARQSQRSPNVKRVRKPRRWDRPFGRQRLDRREVGRILSYPIFHFIDPRVFPADLTLGDIIANDGRVIRYSQGDIIYRKGDYGESLFMILRGAVRGLLTPAAEQAALVQNPPQKPSWVQSLSKLSGGENKINKSSDNGVRTDGLRRLVSDLLTTERPITRVADVSQLITKFPTFALARGGIFGEHATLTRGPRGNTVFAAEDETILLELRWPGVRDLRHWSDFFRQQIDGLYRVRGIHAALRECPLFDNVDTGILNTVAQHSHFETHGRFDWTHHYQREMAGAGGGGDIVDHEPVIAAQDNYIDDVLLICSGFARLSEKVGRGERTVGLLTKGDVFGLTEITANLGGSGDRMLRQSLRAIGYVDVVRVPAHIVEEYLWPVLQKNGSRDLDTFSGRGAGAQKPYSIDSGIQQSMLDFTIDNRFINGARAMAINTDRCVNCDDCVRACASTHDNIPRFVRQGKTHQNLMIANACMHCADPVCLIDCPTGAIHRDADTGIVIIDDQTCVGCASCANACPYNNIRMEEVRDSGGAFLVDDEGIPIVRATKCDFCAGQYGGPACQRACPHDALIRVDIRDADTLSAWLIRTQ